MNYYRRYMGDYMRDTMHLSFMEHGAYNLMLDAQYSTEKPLPADYEGLFRICRAMTRPEQEAVRKIADEFFPLSGGGRINPRAWREIKAAQATIEKQRMSGVESSRKRWSTDSDGSGSSGESTDRYTDGLTDPPSIQPPTTNLQPPTTSLQPPRGKALSGKPDADPPSGKNGHDYLTQARDILDYLNRNAGRTFRPVEANLKLIVARLKSGATPLQCREVVFAKCEQWGKDAKMAEYLRPATLFNATKFEQYLGELRNG